MENTIGIIADDLTGANDSGVQLAKHGFGTSVLFEVPNNANPLDHALVIDTNSRSLKQSEAILAVREASEYLKRAHVKHIYKKIDSTLRGHLAIELVEIKKVFEPEFLIIAPAFPAYGRTTVGGVHYVNGIELSETEVKSDPTHPVRESEIKRILEKEIKEEIGSIFIEDIQRGLVKDRLAEYKEKDICYIVCDAETEEDLWKIVNSVLSITDNIVWVGSAGLTEALAECIVESGDSKNNIINNQNYVMTVCGSLSEVSQKQVAFAINQSDVAAIKVDTRLIFDKQWDQYKQKYSEEIMKAFRKNKNVVLYVPSDQEIIEAVNKLENLSKLSNYEIGQNISGALGDIVLLVTENFPCQIRYVLTGGDTAKSISKKLGATGLKLLNEIEPGIPVGKLIGTKCGEVVITKAGGFGQEDSLYRAMQLIKEEKR